MVATPISLDRGSSGSPTSDDCCYKHRLTIRCRGILVVALPACAQTACTPYDECPLYFSRAMSCRGEYGANHNLTSIDVLSRGRGRRRYLFIERQGNPESLRDRGAARADALGCQGDDGRCLGDRLPRLPWG